MARFERSCRPALGYSHHQYALAYASIAMHVQKSEQHFQISLNPGEREEGSAPFSFRDVGSSECSDSATTPAFHQLCASAQQWAERSCSIHSTFMSLPHIAAPQGLAYASAELLILDMH
jgi:hypothetical protein